ncbi:unnamed protein product [Brachionus calyciflorus]|uniref:Uncharacterized protein n=1 Tax=Brachionus calyciflorus TaxID=104777 RepID=A0A814KPD7_9BILA|nr:unnamed protein product [Brachionus calyciflorus]
MENPNAPNITPVNSNMPPKRYERDNWRLLLFFMILLFFIAVILFFVWLAARDKNRYTEYNMTQIDQETKNNKSLIVSINGDLTIMGVEIAPRLNKAQQCSSYLRKFSTFCNYDVPTCNKVNLHKAIFNIFNDLLIDTFDSYSFKWTDNLAKYQVLNLSDFSTLSIVNNSTVIGLDLILLFKYNVERPEIVDGQVEQNTKNKINKESLIKNIQMLFSYCDWFTLDVKDLKQYSTINIANQTISSRIILNQN